MGDRGRSRGHTFNIRSVVVACFIHSPMGSAALAIQVVMAPDVFQLNLLFQGIAKFFGLFEITWRVLGLQLNER